MEEGATALGVEDVDRFAGLMHTGRCLRKMESSY